MLRIKIVAVGNLKEKYFVDAVKEYSKRITPFAKLEICEIQEANSSISNIEQIKNVEGQKILSELDGFVVVLDSGGKQLTSPELAEFLKEKAVSGVSKISFVIGGSVGLSDEVKQRANLKLSMSKMTFPHHLARAMLLEQIYRAFKISDGGKYHK